MLVSLTSLESMSIASSQYPPPLSSSLTNASPKFDWASESPTTLTANEDSKAPVSTTTPKDNSSSPAVSDDGPSTPPSRLPQQHSHSHFTNSSAWHDLSEEFTIKMHMSDQSKSLYISNNPQATAATAAAASPPVAHSRASSGDTSLINDHPSAPPVAVHPPLQINTAVGAARATKPFTAGPDPRPRFQDSLEVEHRRRQQQQQQQQIISPKVHMPAINTAVNGQGPRTSPPRERFPSPENQRLEAARYPSLQDQPQPQLHQQQQPQPTFPSIHHQGQFHQGSVQHHQQQQQHHQAHNRPPPIHVVNQGSLGGMLQVSDEFNNTNHHHQSRLPSSAGFQQQQNRVVSDSSAYPRHAAAAPPRGTPQIPPPPPHMYPTPYANHHLSMGANTPQLYDLSLPGSPFRAAHQHTTSDPATLSGMGVNVSLREQVALMQTPHMPPPMHSPYAANHMAAPPPGPLMYAPPPPPQPQQYFHGQDPFFLASAAAAAASATALRFPGQTPGTPGQIPQPPPSATPSFPGSPTAPQSAGGLGGGPSANNRKLGLYKTELCRSWEEKGTCRYGPKCQFAHGEEEVRKVARHPKYKTEICRTFWVSGSCPYGKRCCFIHTELPSSGGPPASANSANTGSTGSPTETPTSVGNPPSSAGGTTVAVGRGRSQSVTSDPNDAPTQVSLLTRIANQRTADAHAAVVAAAANAATATPDSSNTTTPTFQFPQQRPNSLRVDTSALDTQISMKQNKSAYPYMTNPSLPKNSEHMPLISPGPVTAGPDLGRGASRFDAYDRFNRVQTPTTTTQATPTGPQPSGSNSLRHSFNGTETLSLQTQLALSGQIAPPSASNAGNGGTSTATSSTNLTHSRSESASGGGGGGGGGGGNTWNAPGFARSGGGGGAVIASAAASGTPPPWNGELSVGANRPGSNGGVRGGQQQ